MNTKDPSFEPAHNNMGHHIASGILNSGVAEFVKTLCQFASLIILSRLLSPSDFGIIAMVGPAWGFVALFQDLGLSQATIQKSSIGHDEINAFFWINVAVGACLALLIVLLSPVVGWYYNDPRVVPLTASMGALIFISALGNQQIAILSRRMSFNALAINGVMGTVCSLLVAVGCALWLKNYWALYCGLAAGLIAPTVGAWIATRWTPTMPRRVSGIGSMLKFGANITSAKVTSFLSSNTDNMLIGWKSGEQTLGLYDRAYKLLIFPIHKLIIPAMGTLIPVLSRLADEPERYRAIATKSIAQTALAAWPGIIWALLLSSTLVPTLLGQRWAGVAPIFVPLALTGLAQIINSFAGGIFTSQGRTKELAWWSFFCAFVDILCFVIGLPHGAVGVATAYAVSEYARTPVLWLLISRHGPVTWRHILPSLLPQAAGGIAAAAALLAYRQGVDDAPPLVFLAGGLLLSYSVMIATTGLSRRGRETLRHTLDVARTLLRHTHA